MIATPSLTLNVTPPGGSTTNYASHLAWSGAEGGAPTITQNFGRQGDTAMFVLVDEYNGTPNFVIEPMSQVALIDNIAGVTLFAGVANDPQLMNDGPIRNEWTLNCTDYTYYADNEIVRGTFFGLTADQIIIALTEQANCGISAVSTAAGGFVAPGPQLASVVINYMTLSDAWRKLAQLSGQVTPFGWYVDENLRLHFYDATSAIPSGVTFTTSPTAAGAGSLTEGHIAHDSQTNYEWDGTSIRNRIRVHGATQTITVPTTGPPTDTWVGDGITSSWPLRYTLNSNGSPLLKIGNVATSVTVVTGGGTGIGTWQVQQNSVGSWFLITSSPPGAGVMIQFWYNYDVPVAAQANDATSQSLYTGPNGGVFAEFINDTSLTTVGMALARAQRERTEYAFAAERANFTTTEEFFGWVRAGYTFQYVNQFIPDSQRGYAIGINDKFICISNEITFGDGGYRTMSITGVRI